VGILSIYHPFPALLLVGLLGALLLDEVEIVDQTLHLVLPRSLVLLDVLDHDVDSLLGLFELVFFGFFHVEFDCFGSFHSQIVLDHIDVFVDFGDLLVGVDESK
jgi:hypothetical protein